MTSATYAESHMLARSALVFGVLASEQHLLFAVEARVRRSVVRAFGKIKEVVFHWAWRVVERPFGFWIIVPFAVMAVGPGDSVFVSVTPLGVEDRVIRTDAGPKDI